MTLRDIAAALQRPRSSVQVKASRIFRGVVHHRPGPVWTPERLEQLRDLYPRMRRKQVALEMGITDIAVKAAATTYGIRKFDYELHPERLTDMQVGYIAGLIDGEGSLLIVKAHHREYGTYLRPYCSVATMAEHEVPEEVAQWLQACGIGVTARICKRRLSSRNVTELLIRRQRDIIAFLEHMRPHLIAKRQRAKVLTAFCKASTQQERWNLYRQLQALIPLSAQRRKFSQEVNPL